MWAGVPLALVGALALGACSSGHTVNAGAPAASSSAPAPGASASPAASPAANCPAPSTVLKISASNALFDTHCLAAPAGQPLTIEFTNMDDYQHNVAILKDANSTPLFAGQFYAGPGTVTYHVPALPAGTYLFECQIHPFIMNGQLIVS